MQQAPLNDSSLGPGIGGLVTKAPQPVTSPRTPGLEGQTVVVIGGSSGIGLETARLARRQRADVIITVRDLTTCLTRDPAPTTPPWR